MFIEEGKKALEYSPNNIKIYYLIATSTIKIPLPFEAKWAIKEGLRLELDKYDEDQLFYKCILILGKCCKYEMKKEQAKYYFDVILESEDDRLRDYYQEAQTESFSLEPF